MYEFVVSGYDIFRGSWFSRNMLLKHSCLRTTTLEQRKPFPGITLHTGQVSIVSREDQRQQHRIFCQASVQDATHDSQRKVDEQQTPSTTLVILRNPNPKRPPQVRPPGRNVCPSGWRLKVRSCRCTRMISAVVKIWKAVCGLSTGGGGSYKQLRVCVRTRAVVPPLLFGAQ